MAIDGFIEHLSISKYEALHQALDRSLDSETWIKVISAIQENFHTNINITLNPNDESKKGEKLLLEFQIRRWPIQRLLEISKRCKLYEVLALFITEPMVIEKQPNEHIQDGTLSVKLGSTFTLDFDVHSIPRPSFQWYKDDKVINGQTQSKISYEHFVPELEGVYQCTAIQNVNGSSSIIKSDSLSVDALPELYVYDDTVKYTFKVEGESFKLTIKASGYPRPKFVWTKKNTILEDVTGDTLYIEQCNSDHDGEYQCQVSNPAKSVIIKFNLRVISFFISEEIDLSPVSNKIALLIGNNSYKNWDEIDTLQNDINRLANALEKKNFYVETAFDSDLKQMEGIIKNTFERAKEGSYILFYYSGHGISISKDNYLIPSDCPEPGEYSLSNCYSECKLIQEGLKYKPKLLFFMLDMCLELSSRDEIYKEQIQPCDYRSGSNMLISYSTTSRLKSINIDNKNLYLEALIKNIELNLPTQKIVRETMRDVQNGFTRKIEIFRRKAQEGLKKNPDPKIERELNLHLEELIRKTPIPSVTNNLTIDYDLNAPVKEYKQNQVVIDSQNYRRNI